jgi:uncharacterized protein (TIGR00251 family)
MKAGTVIVHVQPRAQVSQVVGWHGDAVKIRVAAPPVDGAANDALTAFVATRLGVPQTSVRIVSGAQSRRKRLLVDGKQTAEVLTALGLDQP